MSGVQLGRDFRLDIRISTGPDVFEIIGPVNTNEPSNASPTVDVTTQSSLGDNSEFNHTGYSQFQISVAGIVKEEAGTDPVSGLDFFTYKQLIDLANETPVTARKFFFRLIDSLETFEGTVLITEFARTGGRSDAQEFSMSLQAEGPDYKHTVAP